MKKKLLSLVLLLIVAVGGAQAQSSGNWSDEGNRDTSWGSDYASSTEFAITTPEQLAQFAFMVNNGSDFSGKTVTLNQCEEKAPFGDQVWTYDYYDIRDYNWTPIGTADHPFNGTFNGNGKEVNYVKIDDDAATYQGLFGYVGTAGAIISTTVRMSTITAASQVGAIAGYNGGTMTNCVVTDITITGSSYAGAIVGQNAGTMTSCYAIASGSMKAIGVSGSATGQDLADQGQSLWKISGSNIEVSKGNETGTTVGNAVFYDDGIQYNYYHYYKTGTTATVTYTKEGYNATFSVSGEGASISGNVVTVGTADVTVTVESTSPAEWSGTGIADDPYLIYNREQLDMLATRVNSGGDYNDKCYRLESDLDYDGITYTAIGTLAYPFTGTFDGNGHEIEGPQISLQSTQYQGIIGYNKGTIKNLKVSNPYILGGDYSGGIAGYNEGTIENCRVDNERGVFYGEDGHHSYGGIAGYNKGTISYCICAASVESNSNATYTATKVGGIVGHNNVVGNVNNCLYLGRIVDGTEYVGAIAGLNEGGLNSNFYHNNKYKTYDDDNIGTTVLGVGTSGSKTGTNPDVAAKAKVLKLPEGGTSSKPYGATVSGTATYVTTNNPNGMALSVYSNGILFRDTYFASSNGLSTAFYTAATTVELEAINVPSGYAATFTTTSDGASFNGNTLTVGTDVTEVSVSAQRIPAADSWLADGVRASSFSTTGDNSITITSAAELGLLAYNVNFASETYSGYTITIGADVINLDGHAWEPIGYGLSSGGMGYGGGSSSPSGFLGTFDGAGKAILNMNVNGSTYVGLFSNVQSGATVKNVLLSAPQVKGEMVVGAIAGSVSGTLENCHVINGNVELASSEYAMYIGGIAGQVSGGSIKGCTVKETNIYPVVASAQGIGGIVGSVSPGMGYTLVPATLKDCLFAGNIFKKEGNAYVGAIAGMNQDYSAYGEDPNTITNNYYIDGNSPLPSVTPNTTLYGINGADVTDGAELAYEYDGATAPEGIGTAGTQYDYNGVIPYTNGILYGKFYVPIAPVTKDITLNDTEDNSTILQNYKGIDGMNVTLNRTFYKDGSWNTICLPFGIEDINAAGCPLAGGELWQLVEQGDDADTGLDDEGTLTLNFEDCKDVDTNSTTLAAGYSYLIRWANTGKTISNPVFNDVTITATSPIADTFGQVSFVGTFAKQTFEAENRSVLLLGAANTLYWPQPSGGEIPSIGAFRAYFLLDGINAGNSESPVRAFVLNFGEDETNGISTTKGTNSNGTWYDLSGRRLSGKPTQHGMYINNGRKVVIN